MRNLRLLIEYDGTAYSGWQRQPDRPTVQAAIETAIERVTGHARTLYGSGRTDTGVHARGQVANVHTDWPHSVVRLRSALDATTPDDIGIREVDVVDDDFHARRSAVSKTYSYTLHEGEARPVLDRHRVVHIRGPVDRDAMRQAAAGLVGRHDFAAFQAADSPRHSTVRELQRLALDDDGPRLVVWLQANGFLYKMCRAIVGTLLEVGRGRRHPDLASLLAGRSRLDAGPTAPAHGLVLEHVEY